MHGRCFIKMLLSVTLGVTVAAFGHAQTCLPGTGPTTTVHPGDDVQVFTRT